MLNCNYNYIIIFNLWSAINVDHITVVEFHEQFDMNYSEVVLNVLHLLW